jgi:hypothetical protein
MKLGVSPCISSPAQIGYCGMERWLMRSVLNMSTGGWLVAQKRYFPSESGLGTAASCFNALCSRIVMHARRSKLFLKQFAKQRINCYRKLQQAWFTLRPIALICAKVPFLTLRQYMARCGLAFNLKVGYCIGCSPVFPPRLKFSHGILHVVSS